MNTLPVKLDITKPLPESFVLEIKGIKGFQFPKKTLFGKYAFYVKFAIDQQHEATAVSAKKTTKPEWPNSILYFHARPSDVIRIQVYIKSRNSAYSRCVGEIEDRVRSLLREAQDDVVSRPLVEHGTATTPGFKELTSFMGFTVSIFSSNDPHAVQQALAIQNAQNHLGLIAPILGDTTTDAWLSLLDNIERFTKFVDAISEAHPFAKAAWSLLKSTYDIFKAQQIRDESVNTLLQIMSETLDIVLAAKSSEQLNHTKSQQTILTSLAQQIVECTYFISSYSTTNRFFARAVENMFSDADIHIKQYELKFKSLRSLFQEHSTIQTETSVAKIEVLVFRMLSTINIVAEDTSLNDMPYAMGACFNKEKTCLPGTRKRILDEIINWVNFTHGHRLYILVGMAGHGKSAIVHSLAAHFDALGRLGSSFCFDRAHEADQRHETCFSTIARDLADLDPHWKQALLNIIKGNRSLRTTHVAQEQFERFILEPAASVTTIGVLGPIVIVIDGFDEISDPQIRAHLFKILVEQSSKLPSNVCIILATRPDPTLMLISGQYPSVVLRDMKVIEQSSTLEDISLFISAQISFEIARQLDQEFPKWHTFLVHKSEGVFQWASTACLYIIGARGGSTPSSRFNLIQTQKMSKHQDNLDKLYLSILKNAIDDSSNALKYFQIAVGHILAAKEPISIRTLKEIAFGDDPNMLDSIIQALGALLSGVSSEDEPLQILHSSLWEFLTSKERSFEFYIDINTCQPSFVIGSLQIMERLLQFNICQLETSYIKNTCNSKLSQLVSIHIPASLLYASQFWAEHLQLLAFDDEIFYSIERLMGIQFLYWLEVLSLVQKMDIAFTTLKKLEGWIKLDHNHYISEFKTKDLSLLIQDARKMLIVFGSCISESTPHIYLSAIPFLPNESYIARLYKPKYPQILELEKGSIAQWPAIQRVLEGHTHYITAIAISQDGQLIASGSYDKTIRIWDIELGSHSLDLFLGHTDIVNCVAFSTDASYVASGSADKSVRLWERKTGPTESKTLWGHKNSVTSVAFSLDQIELASGSMDRTIRIWNVKSLSLKGILRGHTKGVHCVLFTSDCQHIISGSSDNTVKIWHSRSGACIQTLHGHSGIVHSLAISNRSEKIASSSSDGTIRIWDFSISEFSLPKRKDQSASASIKTAYVDLPNHHDYFIKLDDESELDTKINKHMSSVLQLTKYLEHDKEEQKSDGALVLNGKHNSWILSVAFSHDDQHLVSSSVDGTIWVWNVNDGEIAFGPFLGHNSHVTSVTFSPDSQYIISGSWDTTIRVWDTKNETPVKIFASHEGPITSASFSPDGKCIISGSEDKSVRVWDAHSGYIMFKPLIGHSSVVSSVAYAPNGKFAASASYDNTIFYWNVDTGFPVYQLHGHSNWILSISFSKDGKYLVSGGCDKQIRVWNVETGEAAVAPWFAHSDAISCVAFSSDSTYIASASIDKTVKLWKLGNYSCIHSMMHKGMVSSVAFSPDSMYIASGSYDAAIYIWEVASGMQSAIPFHGHLNAVTSVAFSPNGRNIISGSYDNTIRIWSVDTGKEIYSPFIGHDGPVLSVSFSLDGDQIMSCSADATIRTWDLARDSTQIASDIIKSDSKTQNGWMLGSNQELLFWVPPWNRHGLWRPENLNVIAVQATKLDFTNFKHGHSWTQCIEHEISESNNLYSDDDDITIHSGL